MPAAAPATPWTGVRATVSGLVSQPVPLAFALRRAQHGPPFRPHPTFRDLTLGARASGQTLDSILGRIGEIGIRALQGWDAAGTSLVENDRVATYGPTDERVNSVDRAQYATGRGPCVDAIKSGGMEYFSGTHIEPPWRQFAEAAGDSGIYSVASFPLRIKGEVVGALNFYSSERDALRNGHREQELRFADQAAITLSNAKALIAAELQVSQFREALETRTIIGQATGLVMAQERLSPDEAFQTLVKASQDANVKLREIAVRYVQRWQEKAGPTRRITAPTARAVSPGRAPAPRTATAPRQTTASP